MFSFTNLLIGIVMTILGVLMVKYSFQLLNMTGPQDWIERFTGGGSTNGMYKIIGVVLALIGIMVATGLGDNVMSFFFSPFAKFFFPDGGK